MIYIIFVLFLVACFFALFSLARNDLVIIRQNITLPSLFDKAFLILLLSYISGRVFYIFENNRFGYFDIITFFYIFKIPGISLVGTFLGILLFLGIFFRNKKNVSRIYDIFLLSFFPLGLFAITVASLQPQYMLLKLILLLVGMFYYFFLMNFHKNYTLKDGSVSLLAMLFIVLISLVIEVLSTQGKIVLVSFIYIEAFVLLLVLSTLFVLNQQFIKRK